jgi:hypothetical protein
MEPVPVTKASITIQVDLEVEYDSFSGKTPEDVAISLQDEISDLLFEASPMVTGVITEIKSADITGKTNQ